MFCPSCNATNLETAKHCIRCGADLLGPWVAERKPTASIRLSVRRERTFVDIFFDHLLANLFGNGYHNTLAQDFWAEPLFHPATVVRFHWVKLVWVYWMSTLTQVTVPLALVGAAIALFTDRAWALTAILVAIPTVLAFAFCPLVAALTMFDLRRARRVGARPVTSWPTPDHRSQLTLRKGARVCGTVRPAADDARYLSFNRVEVTHELGRRRAPETMAGVGIWRQDFIP